MSNYVKVDGGIVVQRQPYHENGFIEAPESVICGWRWDGEVFTPPPAPPPQIPAAVTMRQARLALLGAGLLDDVDAAIASIPDETTRRAAQIEWEFSNEVQRNNSFTSLLGAGLGLSSAQIDALFIQAASI